MHVVEDTVGNIVPDGGHVIVQLSMFLEFFHILTNGIWVLLCSPIKECLNAIHAYCTLWVSLAVEVFEHVQLEGIESFLCLATCNATLVGKSSGFVAAEPLCLQALLQVGLECETPIHYVMLQNKNSKCKVTGSHVGVNRGALEHGGQEVLAVLGYQKNKVANHTRKDTQSAGVAKVGPVPKTAKGVAVGRLKIVSSLSGQGAARKALGLFC
jgi:hypothetical protein